MKQHSIKTVEDEKMGFLLSNRSHSGLMYQAGGAKSIWEPSVKSSIRPKEDAERERRSS